MSSGDHVILDSLRSIVVSAIACTIRFRSWQATLPLFDNLIVRLISAYPLPFDGCRSPLKPYNTPTFAHNSGLRRAGLPVVGCHSQRIIHTSGYRTVVVHQPSKLRMRVRFPLPAPRSRICFANTLHGTATFKLSNPDRTPFTLLSAL